MPGWAQHRQGPGLLLLHVSTWPSHVLQRQRCPINNKKQFPRTELGDYAGIRAPHLLLTGWEGL